MTQAKIRPIAICVCRHGSRILVVEWYDSVKKEIFYRPLGGAIEFGERGEQAVQREFLEEIGARLESISYLGMIENIFTCEGLPGHEIVLVYDGVLADKSLYAREVITGDEMGVPLKVCWKELAEFTPEHPPVYPDGLVELLGE